MNFDIHHIRSKFGFICLFLDDKETKYLISRYPKGKYIKQYRCSAIVPTHIKKERDYRICDFLDKRRVSYEIHDLFFYVNERSDRRCIFRKLPVEIIQVSISNFLSQKDVSNMKLASKELSKVTYRNCSIYLEEDINVVTSFTSLINLTFNGGIKDIDVVDLTPLKFLEYLEFLPLISSKVLLCLPDSIKYLNVRVPYLEIMNFPYSLEKLRLEISDVVSFSDRDLPKICSIIKEIDIRSISSQFTCHIYAFYQLEDCKDFSILSESSSELDIPFPKNLERLKLRDAKAFLTTDYYSTTDWYLYLNQTLPKSLTSIDGIKIRDASYVSGLKLLELGCRVTGTHTLSEIGKEIGDSLRVLTISCTGRHISFLEEALKFFPSLEELNISWDIYITSDNGDFSDSFNNTTIKTLRLHMDRGYDVNTQFISTKGFKALERLRIICYPHLFPKNVPQSLKILELINYRNPLYKYVQEYSNILLKLKRTKDFFIYHCTKNYAIDIFHEPEGYAEELFRTVSRGQKYQIWDEDEK
jgi:hypothetical protein